MHPADIQAALKKRGIKQKDLAATLGISEMTLSVVIRKIRISNRVMRGIAEAIGKDHREVFPEYFLAPPKRSTSKVSNF